MTKKLKFLIIMDNTNIFFHAPKELTTDAFLVWVIYYLDSDIKFEKYKQSFFDKIILKKEDRGKKVDNISLRRQENDVDVILSFHFKSRQEERLVLFENKTWTTTHDEQLVKYKTFYPNCYRYLYYKLGYVNSQERMNVGNDQYDIIDVHTMCEVLEDMRSLHPLIDMYYKYIKDISNGQKAYEDELFKKNYSILWDGDAQKFLCDMITSEMAKLDIPYLEIRNGTSFGRPWTQIDIAEKKADGYGYWEKLFWRVDIRSNKFYVRLNQYGEPSNQEETDAKLLRRDHLRKECANIVSTIKGLQAGSMTNGTYESEVLIFFLEDNDFHLLLKSIPRITNKIVKFFYDQH